jgi:hypothetical protein
LTENKKKSTEDVDRETLGQVVRARADISVVLGCMSLPVLFERVFSS